MGTARIQREALEGRERLQREAAITLQRDLARSEIASVERNIEALRQELATRRHRLESLDREQVAQDNARRTEETDILTSRRADDDTRGAQ